MKTIDILCPHERQIKILGKTITLRPLSIKQTIILGRILGQIKTELEASLKDEKQNPFLKILELAGTNKTREILDVFTNNEFKDIANLEDKLSLIELSNLALALTEVNDFKQIMLNFRAALKAINN
ncbi:MAG: hypothetical protein II183_00370 [Elusimicrobiaceae bacterium]|nr:hypothetical protein [Elusimicrobiaceae bacterium]